MFIVMATAFIAVIVIFCSKNIVSNPQVKKLYMFNQVYSMIPSHKSLEYLCEITTGENRMRSEQRRREGEKEQWINRVREGALDRNGNGVG
jgi:hypothetical protein